MIQWEKLREKSIQSAKTILKILSEANVHVQVFLKMKTQYYQRRKKGKRRRVEKKNEKKK